MLVVTAGMFILAFLCISLALVLVNAKGEDTCVQSTLSNTLSKTSCSTITSHGREEVVRKLVLCVLERLESVPLCTMDEYLECTTEISDMMSELHDITLLGFHWLCLCDERHKIHSMLPQVSKDISMALSAINQDRNGYGFDVSTFSTTDSSAVGASLKSLRYSGTVESGINMLSRSLAETFARTNASFQSHEAAQEQAWAFVRVVIDQMQDVGLRMRKVWNEAFEKAFHSRSKSHVLSAHFSILLLSILLPNNSFSKLIRVLHIVLLLVNIIVGKSLWCVRLVAFLLSSSMVFYKSGRASEIVLQHVAPVQKNRTRCTRSSDVHSSRYFSEDSVHSISEGFASLSEYSSIQLEESCECCRDDELFAR